MIEHLHRLAVHAFYAGEHDAGRRACERLLRMPLSQDLEHVVRRNRTWYTQRLDELTACRFVRLDVEPENEGWSLFNPSIVACPDGFVCNVRSSNYAIVDGRYVMPEADGERIRTENILVDLSDDLVVSGVTHRFKADYAATEFPVEGLEDVRLNLVDGELLASATVRNFAPHDGICRIATATADREAGRFTNIECHPTAGGQHEKNWMPIAGRREWLYHCRAREHVATVASNGEEWVVRGHCPAPILAGGFRGGSQLVPVGRGIWMAIVHEVAQDGPRRIYEHRFVEFDEAAGWQIVAVSPPFAFREQRSIEFCAGLAVKGLRMVASFGVRDAEAWLVELSLPDVWRLMERV
jgi:hypothetical protein